MLPLDHCDLHVGDVIAHTALAMTRLDCGNASGLPTCQLNRLKSVLHAAARLVCGARNYDYVTPGLLQELYIYITGIRSVFLLVGKRLFPHRVIFYAHVTP